MEEGLLESGGEAAHVLPGRVAGIYFIESSQGNGELVLRICLELLAECSLLLDGFQSAVGLRERISKPGVRIILPGSRQQTDDLIASFLDTLQFRHPQVRRLLPLFRSFGCLIEVDDGSSNHGQHRDKAASHCHRPRLVSLHPFR